MGGMKTFSDLRKSQKEKAVRNTWVSQSGSEKINKEVTKRIELSVGTFFSIKYEKDFVKRVESLEYTVK